MDKLSELQGNFRMWMQQIKTLLTPWMKISRNAHDQKLSHSDWQLNCQMHPFYSYCTSRLDFYILDAPVSNRLNIEQGVLECINFSTLVEHLIPLTSF